MFNLVKTPKEGTCPARRCKNPTSAAGTNPYNLCLNHMAQWVSDGRPELGKPPTESADASASLVPSAELRAQIVQPLEIKAFALRDKIAAAGLTVDSPAKAQAVGALAAHAQAQINEMETQRKAATGPMNKSLRVINGWFKPGRDAYERVKSMCHAALLDYERAAEQAKAEALARGDHETAMAIAPATLPGGTHARKKFCFRVVNPKLVPPEHWIINAASVQAIVDRDREKTAIPGIEVYEDKTLVTPGVS